MKKIIFVVVTIFSMHIVFPMTNALAADVPELLSVVGGKAIFLEEKSINNKNGVYTTYSYMCDSISQGEDLAVEYCDYLINNAPFVLVGAFENDYTRTSAQEMTNIMFNYVGSKNVGSFKVKNYSTKQQYICNVRVHTCAQYQYGIFEIYISVGSGLTYGN